MPGQQQAFQAYYASMTDAELLAVANNRKSFIPVAQKMLAEELLRRRLAPPDSPVEAIPAPTLLTRLAQMWRRKTSAPPDSLGR